MNMIPVNSAFINSNFSKNDPAETAEQITSVFLKNMMNEIIKNESRSFFSEGSQSYNSFMPDIMVDQLVTQIVKSDAFGINKIFSEKIISKSEQNENDKN